MASPNGPSGRPSRPDRRRHGVAKVLGIVALALVALVLVSASINAILTGQERSRFAPYGQRVSVDGGSLNVWRNGHAGPTMVLLSGLGTAAPALDFAPLIRQLGAYNIFVVEGFGYGYSDLSARPRTVQNITSELHDVLSRLDAPQPYILVGHSIAGFYTLAYAHRYPQEVSAVVGIDPTVPAAKAGSGGTSGLPFHALGTILRMSGLVRAAFTLSPGLAEPTGDAYTPDERAHIRAMSIWTFGNAAVSDETNRMGSNAAALRGVTYPDRLPVLDFLASEKVATDPNWVQQHEDQLRNVQHHEVVVLDGGHYLHWTQSKAMADKITAFLDADLARP
jgi:pimeloyl-ACP methyl ester carboxylesterase